MHANRLDERSGTVQQTTQSYRNTEGGQLCRGYNVVNQLNSDVTMSHMFTISDNESETSDDGADGNQPATNQDNPGEGAVPDIVLTGPELERLRSRSVSQASSQGEEAEPQEEVFEEGEDGRRLRSRSWSAPGALAAKRYGRQLRRMSDEFDTFLDKEAMKKVHSAKMRTSLSWFSFWKRKETDTDLNNGEDSRSAE
ncbi:bcl2-associated agonist of cell death-like [Conger conger]|uniref:bcl2-associated agonist of cell death-like n=1 Tax=Conger conger TaxID=82655 RepID=UPI002A5AEB7A|nr:bcl2-associated agonist of cell death-like [Conger conger]